MTPAQVLSIDPVTRIEGHSRITIRLGADGTVADAQFHVTQFRGFEALCEGRPVHEMPGLMARICGICPVSHLVAAAKAVDAIMAVTPPPAGVGLRRILNLAQLLQSHALSFFHLASPDLLLGFDADPAGRNLFGVLRAHPELAHDGIALRRFGQRVIELLGGSRIHPAGIVPGGVTAPLTPAVAEEILAGLAPAAERVTRTLAWYRGAVLARTELAGDFAVPPTASMALVSADGRVEHYDGRLRVIRADGSVLHDEIRPAEFDAHIGEAVEPWSYLKSSYLTALGYPAGVYRVGPLARLSVAERFGTPRADEELGRQRDRLGRYPASPLHNHYARLVEALYAVERIGQLLRDPEILSDRVRARAGINAAVGVGIAEAPRGTLMHRYAVDDDGLVRQANLVIATGQNNLAMNQAVREVARRFVRADRLTEGALNRVEAVIRCFDPCLSCATHAVGEMPLRVRLLDAAGDLLDERVRG